MFEKKFSLSEISDFIKAILIIGLVLSPVLFLLEHEIKYSLYIFGILFSGIILLAVFKVDIKFNFNVKLLVKFFDYFLILCAIFVFVSNVFGNIESTFNFVLTIFISFFLPGWVLIRVLGINFDQESNLGLLSISFVASAGLTSIIFLFMLPMKEETASLISSVYLVVSLFPLLRDKIHNFKNLRKSNYKTQIQRKYNILDLLLIGGIVIFFVFVISNLYPSMAFVPSDIVRHYSEAIELRLMTDIYASSYPWHHFVLATVQELSDPPVWLFQSGIAFLGVMVLISFYIMSKLYLYELDRRAHIFATIFFFVFSGFGWLYFISQKIFLPEIPNYLDILVASFDVSFWDVGYGQGTWLWFWFRPLAVGFTIFFVLLYLIKKQSLSRIQYLSVTSLLLVTLIQVHVSEFLIFVFLLLIISIVKPTIKLRIKETAICLLVSLVFLSLITTYQELFTSSYHPLSQERILVLIGVSGLILLLAKYPQRPKISVKINWKLATSITLFVYLTFLMYWFFNADNFSVDNVREILGVPWELYPPLLGLVGLIAIPGIFLALRKYRNNPVVIFVILFVSIIVAGRLLTFVNAESLLNTGYWERRLIPYVYSSACILAALFIAKVLEQLNISWSTSYFKKIGIVGAFSFLVVGGILSTYLTIEFQIFKTENSSLSKNEQNFLDLLQGVDPYSLFLTISERSKVISDFQTLGITPNYYRTQIWSSKNPETTLNAFSVLNSPSIIFLTETDLKYIGKYQDGYIASHLLKVGPRIEKEGLVLIQIPPISSPVPTSKMVLILPDLEKRFYFSYDILSLGGYNYSTALISDVQSWKNATILVVPSESLISHVIDYKEKFDISFEELIVLNLDGFGSFLSVNHTTINSNSIVSGKRLTLPFNIQINEFPTALNYNITANYNPDVPFVMNLLMVEDLSVTFTETDKAKKEHFDTFNLHYLNVFPIINELNSGETNSTKLYSVLGKLLNFVNIDLPISEPNPRSKYTLVKDGDISFREAVLQGDSLIQSSSALIYLNSSSIHGKIDDIEFEYKDISKILPVDIDQVIVKTSAVKIKGGIGFYTNSILNSSKLNFVGQPAILLLEEKNGNQTVITGKDIQINLDKSTMLIREPKIFSNGTAKFKDFSAYGKPQRNLQVIDKDVLVIGESLFQTKFSDEFIIAQESSFEGDISQPIPRYKQDEIGNLLNIFSSEFLPYLSILAIVFVIINVLILQKQKSINR